MNVLYAVDGIIYKTCVYCDKLYTQEKGKMYSHFIKKGKFCSHSCHISNNNKNRICKDSTRKLISERAKKLYKGENNPNYRGGGTKYNCTFCGNVFEVAVGQINANKHSGKYCSLRCYHDKQEKERSPITKKVVNKRVQRTMISWVRLDFKSVRSKWVKILGYDGTMLKDHIEKLFLKRMTWSNYGDWHIDHIKPISYFNYTTEYDEGFKQCWDLSNLQPLWALDNLSKGGMNTLINQKTYGTKKKRRKTIV